MNIQQVSRLTEDQARKYIEQIRWTNGPICPHCDNHKNNYKIKSSRNIRPGLYECSQCKKQFTVTVGTVMEDSHVPLSKWVLAFYLICTHRKGISARQLQHDLDLGSYRTAWHMCHRIRLAMKDDVMGKLLRGKVEVDETYIGGKPRKGTTGAKRGRGTKKTPVMTLIQRGGKARTLPIANANATTLKGTVTKLVHRKSTIMTDEWPGYWGLVTRFAGGHKMVNHSKGEYSRKGINVNTCESYFALFKRGLVGTFHHISKRHTHRYCNEFDFRWNTRDWDDEQTLGFAVKNSSGKRLTYDNLVNHPSHL